MKRMPVGMPLMTVTQVRVIGPRLCRLLTSGPNVELHPPHMQTEFMRRKVLLFSNTSEWGMENNRKCILRSKKDCKEHISNICLQTCPS